MSSGNRRHRTTPREEWSKWGDWIWSNTYSAYYRQRQDIHGNVETSWATENNYAAAGGKSTADPRQPDIDELAETVDNFNLDDGDAEEDGNYVAAPGKAAKKSSKGKGKSSSKKGKYSVAEDDNEEDGPEGYVEGGQYAQQPYTTDTGAPYTTTGRAYSKNTGGYEDTAGGGYDTQYGPEYEQGYENEYDQREVDHVKAASLREQRSAGRYGSQSQSSRHVETSTSGHKSSKRTDYGYAGDEDINAPTGTEYGTDGGYGSKRPGAYDITGDEGTYEPLDPRYRLEPSSRFQPGEVFKVLWPEPQGSGIGGTPTISDTQRVKTKHGEPFYIGFRRFIVVANDQGHCQCIPILTYGGKGLKKKGIKPETHGVVYDIRKGKYTLPDEPKAGFPSVRLELEVDGEKLAKESRVNYSKIVTVEHNVKVFFIGHIYPDDYELVHDAVNKCWERKVVYRKKR